MLDFQSSFDKLNRLSTSDLSLKDVISDFKSIWSPFLLHGPLKNAESQLYLVFRMIFLPVIHTIHPTHLYLHLWIYPQISLAPFAPLDSGWWFCSTHLEWWFCSEPSGLLLPWCISAFCRLWAGLRLPRDPSRLCYFRVYHSVSLSHINFNTVPFLFACRSLIKMWTGIRQSQDRQSCPFLPAQRWFPTDVPIWDLLLRQFLIHVPYWYCVVLPSASEWHAKLS